MKRKLALYIFLCCNSLVAFCQTSFNMTNSGGHYYILASVNSRDSVAVFVESEIPGLLINEDAYKRLFDDSLYERVDSGYSEIKYADVSHKVSGIRKGKVLIGDVTYQGKIYIIDKHDKICVPLLRLKNEKNSAANMIRLDFNQGKLDFVGQDVIDVKKMNEYKIVKSSPKPVVESSLFIADPYGHHGSITGNFIFDLGSATPLFLFGREPAVKSFVNGNDIKAYAIKDKSGQIMGYGILANSCRIGKKTNNNASVGVVDMKLKSGYLGCIGPSFFDKGCVVIDVKNNVIYYK